MKLYKRVSRFRVLRAVPKPCWNTMKWGLTLQPGDMINDCSGFNAIIEEIDILCKKTPNNGWYIYGIDFTTEPYGGSCSLLHCGVCPPKSPESITNWFKEFYNYWDERGGWEFKTDNDLIWTRLKAGLPICDDTGMRHPDLIKKQIK